MNHTLSSLAVLALLASGCTTPSGQPDASFGEAVKRNIAAQIANPNAPVGDPKIATDGRRAAVAQQHYQTDTVKEPETVKTSEIGITQK